MDQVEKRQQKKLVISLIIIFIFVVIFIIITKGCNSFINYQNDLDKKGSNQPYVVTESSCWWGNANGRFSVKTEKYGLLCEGNSYATDIVAYENPLVIKSNGNKLTVALEGNQVKKVTMSSGDEKVIKSKQGALSYTYIYVKVT